MFRNLAYCASATVALAVLLSAAPHDPDGRLKQLNRRIAKNPGDARLYLQRGEHHRSAGHLKLALKDFEQVEALRPDLHGVHLARAMTLIAAGRKEQALLSVDRFLSKVPGHGFAILTQARALFDLGRHQEAAEKFDTAIGRMPRVTPEHYLEQARAHAHLGATGVQAAVERLRAGARKLGPIVSMTRYAKRLGANLESIQRSRPDTGTAATRAPTIPTPTTFVGETVLVPMGANWKYLDDGSDEGTRWRSVGFDDSAWAAGDAQLGYGDGDETTIVGYGSDPTSRHITTYFRHSFQLASTALIRKARIRLQRDDGAVVYLNGVEIARSNMPRGAIDYRTLATADVNIVGEFDVLTIPVTHTALRTGTNVVAVEIHQVKKDSDDISLDFELRASDGIPVVERGPYLQSTTSTSTILRWRTDYPTETVAFLGTAPTNLTAVVSDTNLKTEHTAVLRGLSPDRQYFYGVGNQSGILVTGTDHFFRTSPPIGTHKKTRIWALGDSGTGEADAAAVRDAYLNYQPNVATDLMLMLGDNAYFFGSDVEHQRAVFDMYPTVLRNTCLWPTIGNHEVYTSRAATKSGPYYQIFDLPTNGEAGGLASGTESYYSFDYGDIHFVCLNSSDEVRLLNAPMMTWLKADLAATKARWIIAFWHHPPYSKGSHDSDDPTEFESIDMRNFALPLLEQAGVDLVLTGHSHSYERSLLLNGHHGFSNTLLEGMKVDKGDGRQDSHGAYAKRTVSKGAYEGAVYVVAGCSGFVTGGSLDHPAMLVSTATLGSLVIDIDQNRMDVRFLTSTGSIEDRFTILKGSELSLTRDEPTLSLSSGGVQKLFLNAGPNARGDRYRVAGSLGTSPGLLLGNVMVPLNFDPWMELTLSQANSGYFQNTLGILDYEGRAEARLAIPPLTAPSAIGLRLHHAFITFDATRVKMASNPVSLTLVK